MRSWGHTVAALMLLAWIPGCIDLEQKLPSENESDHPGIHVPAPGPVLDTVLLVCGAEYPHGYDWRRDTAYGRVSADMVLFRNGERILTIKGGSADGMTPYPDMHYLMDDGHLYSQGEKDGRTVIFRDGLECITYKGLETISGLAIVDGDLYTLGQKKDGGGFSYRKNGRLLLSRDYGHIVGQMNSNPFYRTGALYSDCGQLHFAYWREEKKGQYGWTLVTDGVESSLRLSISPSRLFDLRVIGGEVYRLMSTPDTRACVLITGATEMSVSPAGASAKLCSLGMGGKRGVVVGGKYLARNGNWASFLWSEKTGVNTYLGNTHHYIGDEDIYEVTFSYGGAFSVSESFHSGTLVRGTGTYFPGFRNGVQFGGQLHLAINPEAPDKPGYWSSGKWRELELHGYLNGIQVLLEESRED